MKKKKKAHRTCGVRMMMLVFIKSFLFLLYMTQKK